MDDAIRYLSNHSEPQNKLHWLLIGFGLFWYLVAITTTWFYSFQYPYYYEWNPLSALAFQYIGMIPTFLIALIFIIVAMVSVPYTFRQNKRVGIAINLCFVIFFLLDGGHNLYHFTGNILVYIPHEITTNIMYSLGL